MKLTSIAVGVVNEINRKLISSFLSKIPKLLLNLQILAMSCDSSAYSVRDWKAIDNIKSRIPIRNNNYIRRKNAIQAPPVINAIIVQLQYQWMINYIFYLFQFDMLLLNSQKKKFYWTTASEWFFLVSIFIALTNSNLFAIFICNSRHFYYLFAVRRDKKFCSHLHLEFSWRNEY